MSMRSPRPRNGAIGATDDGLAHDVSVEGERQEGTHRAHDTVDSMVERVERSTMPARAEINDASVPARTPHSMTASLRRALDTRVLVASLFLLALAIFVGIFVPAFYRESNTFILLRQTAMLGIVALGETLVLIVGGIDLSVTSVIGLAVVIIGQMSPYGTVGALLSIPMVVAFGMSVGAVNGTLVTLRKMPPFIATLAMNTALFGAILAYTGGLPSGEIPSVLLPIGLDGIGPLPYSFLLWCFLAVSLAVVLRYTVFGRQIYATGLNREAARLAGLPVRRTVFLAYVICGGLAAVAGIVLSAWIGYVDQTLGTGYDLNSIAAAIVGGATFAGGRGSMLGAVAGAFFMSILVNVMILSGVNSEVQLIVEGAVILGAVAMHTWARRAAP